MQNRRWISPLVLAVVAVTAPLAHAGAQPLTIVNVGAPQVNCLFSTSCSVTVSDHTAPLFGGGFLQSRTFQAAPGSPAAGKWVYQYRVDMRNATWTTAVPYVSALAVPFIAPEVAMDFNGDGSAGDQVFVVTTGGLGSVAPSAAHRHGDTIYFQFSPPVPGGSSAGAGQTSFFFGLVAATPPQETIARAVSNVDPDIFLSARGPRLTGASVPGSSGAPLRPVRPGGRPVVPPRPAPPTKPE